jgi:transcriptional regulator NrdR family protein
MTACPLCKALEVETTISRPRKASRYRRKRCRSCGARWSTVELQVGACLPVAMICEESLEGDSRRPPPCG